MISEFKAVCESTPIKCVDIRSSSGWKIPWWPDVSSARFVGTRPAEDGDKLWADYDVVDSGGQGEAYRLSILYNDGEINVAMIGFATYPK